MPLEIAGKKISYWWIAGGGAGLVLIFYIYKKSAASNAAGSATGSVNANTTDPVTGLPYSQDNQIDPVTGMTYLQEAQEYGSVSAAEQEVSSGAGYYTSGAGSYVGTAGVPTGYYGDYGTTTTSGSSYSTNAQWAQAVTAGLVELGYNSQDVATALGLFFAQQPLGSGSDGVSYASIVQAAEAEFGPPPQGTYYIIPTNTNSTGVGSTGGTGGSTGTGGTGGGTGGGGTGGSGNVTVPNVVGKTIKDAHGDLTAAGLVYDGTPSFKKGYNDVVTAQNPAAGTKVPKGSRVSLTWHYVRVGIVNPGGPNKPVH